jgi:putative DNA primase/helicase
MPAIAEFNHLISQFLAKPASFEDEILQTKVLPLSPEAKDAWIAFHDQVEKELGEGGQFYMIRGWGAKAAEQVARVAANFQIAVCKDPVVVDLDSILRAIQVVSYYLNESLRLSTTSKSKDTARVLNWLIKRAKKLKVIYLVRFEIQQYIHNDLRDSQKIEDALFELEKVGFIQCFFVDGKDYVFLNPHLMVSL